jgi:hypothetical protein
MFRFYSDSVIGNGKQPLVSGLLGRNVNTRHILTPFDGIPDQILKQ